MGRRLPGRLDNSVRGESIAKGAWRLMHQCRTAFYHDYMTCVEGGTRTGAAIAAFSSIS
jgi:hypothetical protein